MGRSDKLRDDQPAVKLGLIGAGLIGKKHAVMSENFVDCRLVGISDVNPSAKALADELGVNYYADYEEMIAAETPEGIIIATPTESHTPVGVTCAQHGVHLFVEKPIAANVRDAQILVESAW
ncbi:MAG: Gfo/Idh/MocA family oxidoreductase [Desulfobacterales bacterium]|nr:MAG: Gfo/Idh/MocA family oxidoreductase [Desulfobacterales bacterium]